jgi:hypothetical protein
LEDRLAPDGALPSHFALNLPVSATAGSSEVVSISAEDTSNQVVTGYTGTVHFTSTDTHAVLPADYTFTAADTGQHAFTLTFETSGTHALRATDTTHPSITGLVAAISVAPAAASSLEVRFASFQLSPSVPSQPFTVTALDPYGNVATGYTGTVHFTATDTGAALPGTYTFTAADAGTHAFAMTPSASYQQWLTATDTSNSGITGSRAYYLGTLAASSFSVDVAPAATGASGDTRTVTVTARNVQGGVQTDYVSTVDFSSTDSDAEVDTPYEFLRYYSYHFVPADKGTHTFSLRFFEAGWQGLRVSDDFDAGIAGAVYNIAVNPASFQLAYPTSTAAGDAHPLTVTVLNADGSVATGYLGTVYLTSTAAMNNLPYEYTFTTADQGRHTFSVALDAAGAEGIRATDSAVPTLTGAIYGINVSRGPLAQFQVQLPSYGNPIGSPTPFTVTPEDAYGNPILDYTGTVHFKSSDPWANLPADYTFVPGDSGTHTFAVTFRSIGVPSVTATDASQPQVSGTGSILNTYGQYLWTAFMFSLSASVQAGVPVSFTVSIRNVDDNSFGAGYTTAVHFTSTDTAAQLPADYTYTLADRGVHTFQVVFETPGPQGLRVTIGPENTYLGDGPEDGSQYGIDVAPTRLSITYPSAVEAGAPQTMEVRAVNDTGQTVAGYTGTVAFSGYSDSLLPSEYTFTAADEGVHDFPVTFLDEGTRGIRATAVDDRARTFALHGITVTAPTLALSVPANVTIGTPVNVVLTVKNPDGSVWTDYTGAIHWTSTDSGATLPPDYTFTPADQGRHDFTATFGTGGTQALRARDTRSATSTGAQTGILVQPVPTATFALGVPTNVAASSPFPLTVTAQNTLGDVATDYTSTVHFTTNAGHAASLPADYTFTATDQGVHVFTIVLGTPGSWGIRITDTAHPGITGARYGIPVS